MTFQQIQFTALMLLAVLGFATALTTTCTCENGTVGGSGTAAPVRISLSSSSAAASSDQYVVDDITGLNSTSTANKTCSHLNVNNCQFYGGLVLEGATGSGSRFSGSVLISNSTLLFLRVYDLVCDGGSCSVKLNALDLSFNQTFAGGPRLEIRGVGAANGAEISLSDSQVVSSPSSPAILFDSVESSGMGTLVEVTGCTISAVTGAALYELMVWKETALSGGSFTLLENNTMQVDGTGVHSVTALVFDSSSTIDGAALFLSRNTISASTSTGLSAVSLAFKSAVGGSPSTQLTLMNNTLKSNKRFALSVTVQIPQTATVALGYNRFNVVNSTVGHTFVFGESQTWSAATVGGGGGTFLAECNLVNAMSMTSSFVSNQTTVRCNESTPCASIPLHCITGNTVRVSVQDGWNNGALSNSSSRVGSENSAALCVCGCRSRAFDPASRCKAMEWSPTVSPIPPTRTLSTSVVNKSAAFGNRIQSCMGHAAELSVAWRVVGEVLWRTVGGNPDVALARNGTGITTILFGASDVRDRGVEFELRSGSCHKITREYSMTTDASEVLGGFKSMGAPTGLLPIHEARNTSLIRQFVVAGGRALRVRIGPAAAYFPERGGAELDSLGFSPSPFMLYPADPTFPASSLFGGVVVSIRSSGEGVAPPIASHDSIRQVVGSIAFAAALTSAFAGSTTLGAQAQRMALANIAGGAGVRVCPFPVDVAASLPFDWSPFPWSLKTTESGDRDPWRYHVGAVALYVILFACLLAIHWLVGLAVMLCQHERATRGGNVWTLGDALDRVRFPTRLLPAVLLVLQGGVASSVWLFFMGDNGVYASGGEDTRTVLGVLGVTSAAMFVLHVSFRVGVFRSAANFPSRFLEKPTSGQRRWTASRGAWAPRYYVEGHVAPEQEAEEGEDGGEEDETGETVDVGQSSGLRSVDPSSESYLRRHGPLFEDQLPGFKAWFVFDAALALIGGALLGLPVDSQARCEFQANSVAALLGAYSLLSIVIRPQVSPVSNATSGLISILQAFSAACGALSLSSDSQSTTFALLSDTTAVLAAMVLCFAVLVAISQLVNRRMRGIARPQRAIDEAQGRLDQSALLLEAIRMYGSHPGLVGDFPGA